MPEGPVGFKDQPRDNGVEKMSLEDEYVKNILAVRDDKNRQKKEAGEAEDVDIDQAQFKVFEKVKDSLKLLLAEEKADFFKRVFDQIGNEALFNDVVLFHDLPALMADGIISEEEYAAIQKELFPEKDLTKPDAREENAKAIYKLQAEKD